MFSSLKTQLHNGVYTGIILFFKKDEKMRYTITQKLVDNLYLLPGDNIEVKGRFNNNDEECRIKRKPARR